MGFESFFNQTLTVNAYTGFDAYGNVTWSTAASTYAAFIIQTVKAIRDKNGVDRISNSQAYLDGSIEIHIEDKITLPEGDTPLILAVQRFPDFNGDYVLTQVFT
jgi:hypothetical protein